MIVRAVSEHDVTAGIARHRVVDHGDRGHGARPTEGSVDDGGPAVGARLMNKLRQVRERVGHRDVSDRVAHEHPASVAPFGALKTSTSIATRSDHCCR